MGRRAKKPSDVKRKRNARDRKNRLEKRQRIERELFATDELEDVVTEEVVETSEEQVEVSEKTENVELTLETTMEELQKMLTQENHENIFENIEFDLATALHLYYINSGYLRYDQYKEFTKCYDSTFVDVRSSKMKNCPMKNQRNYYQHSSIITAWAAKIYIVAVAVAYEIMTMMVTVVDE